MKKFFNVIPSENNTACVLLYGDIGDYGDNSSAEVVQELMELESIYTNIDIRINSMGGEVYTGLAIFNCIKKSKANIHLYIDGIAASMAAVIALCGKPLSMSKYARMMIHSVQGGAYGTKDDLSETITQMASLEDSLAEIIAPRCGMTPDAVKATYFDGADHWLNADQALALGLIDDIYDVIGDYEPIPAGSTADQIYKIFNNRLKEQPKQNHDMNLEELKKRPRFADCVTEAEVFAKIDLLEQDAAKVPGLEKKVGELTEANKVFTDKAAADEKAEITAIVDKAIDEKRIKETQRESFISLLTNDRANGEAILNSLKPQKRIVDTLRHENDTTVGAWDKRIDEIKNNLKK